jgi:multidrug efflux pump subunit AcrA (membrane-fusion protein)
MRARILTLSLIAALGTSLGACKKEAPKPAEAPAVLTVETEAVALQSLPQKLEVTGSVDGWEPMPVSPAANGLRVMAVLAQEGQFVQKGQLLARLDDATLIAQAAAARARARAAAAQLEKMRNPSRAQDLMAAEAAVTQAEATAKQAEDMYARTKLLAAEGAVTTLELITRQTSAEAARAAATQAHARWSLAREGSRREDLIIAEAQAAEARATLAQMEALLEQTRVRAPDAGRVIKKDVALGDVSAVGRAMFQVVRQGRLEVEALVPESDLTSLKIGQKAEVSSDARPDVKTAGVVREISPALDPGSRQATVRLDIPADAGLRVGMFVRARIALGQEQVLAVPASAVVTKEGGAEVFVLENSLARSRAVVPGLRSEGWVGITEGLKPGESVITAGVGFLKDGDKVDVAPPKASEPAAPQPRS